MPVRFHLDENMPHAVAEGLRRRQLDVTITSEAGLMGADDASHLAFALSENRVLVTRDMRLLATAKKVDHAGIVFWTQRRSVGQLIRALDTLALHRTTDDMLGHVEFL